MSVYISAAIRKLVVSRAGHRCEYCRVLEYLSIYNYHIDHIIGIQHGVPNSANNLAHKCSPCNWKKDLISVPYLSLVVILYLYSTQEPKIGLTILSPLMV